MMASAPASAIAASARRFPQLVIEHQRVERHEAARAAAVQRSHRLRQFAKREAHLGAGREVPQAEIHRVGAGIEGGFQLRPVSGRTHHFRFAGNAHGGYGFRLAEPRRAAFGYFHSEERFDKMVVATGVTVAARPSSVRRHKSVRRFYQ
jgi:hypothetical protein